ncbi:hypothetical protein ABPG72_001884 [Tetrahymena utriculariae]
MLMNNNNLVDGASIQQYASKPQQQIQVQYQFQKQNVLVKPPSQIVQPKQIPKQPIFGQKKQEFIQQNFIHETSPDMRMNIQKRESLPKNFQYRVTSVDKNKENLTNIQQNQQQNQAIHVRERSFDNYQSVPPTNLVHIQSQPQLPSDQAQNTISNTAQIQNNLSQHNTSTQSQNGTGSYTSQQQNKQIFQQQYYSSNPNQSVNQKAQASINQFSPIAKSRNQQQLNTLQQQQQNTQQQQQNTVKAQQQQQENSQTNQQQQQNVVNQNTQIPTNLIQELIKSEMKAALKDFKKEEKLENLFQRVEQLEEKLDKSRLKQLIQVESSQVSNEIYQFISELKNDFSAKLTKLNDQLHLNSESCKSNAYAVSQISEKILNFSKEYSETTNKIKEDKNLNQIQIQTFDEKYNALFANFTNQMLDMENNFKKLLVDEGTKIEKQIQQLAQEYNILSTKRNFNQPDSSQSSPQKNNKSINIHNKSSDSISQLPQNCAKSTNTSLVQNMNDYNSIIRDNSSVEIDQNQHLQQLSKNTSSLSQQNLQPQSPNNLQEQYSYSNRSSTQYSRRSHTESNITQSAQNVLQTSPTTSILPNNINNIENYVKKYEEFNKEVDNYLQNRKIPSKVQELMNQSSEMKSSNLLDQGYTIQQQQQFLIQQSGSQAVSPRPLFVNKPLIPTSPNVLIVSPPQADKLQMQTQYDQLYRQQIISQPQFSQQTPIQQNLNVQNTNQNQQLEQKRLNYQSLQQNRKAFEDYNNANSINSSTQISPSRVEQINLDVDSFNNEIQYSNNKIDKNINNQQQQKSSEVCSPQKPHENMKFSIVRSQQKNPQLSMISEQDNEEEELIYQLDDQGYLMDEQGNYIHDEKGQQVKLSGEQIDYLRNQNILEE